MSQLFVVLELSCFFNDPAKVGNLISGSSAFSKSSLNIWKFIVHVLLKPGSENFEHYFTNKGVVKAMVFPVVMYGCASQTIKKAEHQRIDAFGIGENS